MSHVWCIHMRMAAANNPNSPLNAAHVSEHLLAPDVHTHVTAILSQSPLIAEVQRSCWAGKILPIHKHRITIYDNIVPSYAVHICMGFRTRSSFKLRRTTDTDGTLNQINISFEVDDLLVVGYYVMCPSFLIVLSYSVLAGLHLRVATTMYLPLLPIYVIVHAFAANSE